MRGRSSSRARRVPFLRKRTVFFLFLALVVVYICYQALSVGRLGQELTSEYERHRSNPRQYDSYQKADDVFLQPPVPSEVDPGTGIHIRGVRPEDIRFYIPNSRGNFRCMDKTEEYSYARVNDDYCDCSDGSDEPSTSACANGRFYCDFQADHLLQSVYVLSTRVNDGICDCCDGSDEWLTINIPHHMRLGEQTEERLHIDQSPCKNMCVAKT